MAILSTIKTSLTKEEDPTKRLEDLKKRADTIEKKKMSAETELEFLQTQHEEILEKLKDLGITDIEDLPTLIETYEKEITKQVQQIETSISEIEATL